MRVTQKYTLLIFFPFFLIGCGNFNSVHRVLKVSKGEGALIDIKQRAIFSSVITTEDKNGKRITQTKVCAEPSPDALSAYAAELAAKADSGKIGAEFASAFQESSSFVGLRTQSIQLLRDASYRLCESYLSGAISADEYAWSLRRFQRSMVVLLAVEQLTGAVRMPTVSITTQGQAEAAKSVSEIRNEKEKIDNQIKELEGKEQTDKTKEELATLKKDSESMNKAISNARNLLASGSTAVTGIDATQPQAPNATEIVAVAQIVKEMVSSVTSMEDDRGGLCFYYFRALSSQEEGNPLIKGLCEDYFRSRGNIKVTPSKNSDVKIPDEPPFLFGTMKKTK